MKSRTWALISVVAFLGAMLCWWLGNRRQAQATDPIVTNVAGHTATRNTRVTPQAGVRLLSRLSDLAPDANVPGAAAGTAEAKSPARRVVDPRFPYRLQNTDRRLPDLMRSETSVLLRNALIDTTSREALAIPEHLRAPQDAGSYVVQARGPITPAFRAAVEASGATVVSYIPNQSFLVRAPAAAADRLRGLASARAVIPFEPYFKLDPVLLPTAVRQEALSEGQRLMVTAFEPDRAAVREALDGLGVAVEAETRSPFGPQFLVEPPVDRLVALAALPGVQLVEPFADREFLNDLTRVRLKVASDPTNAVTTYGLTGSNVWVNVNDSGIDAQHPDLKGRVFSNGPLLLTDTNGHGTHVAGTIASTGEHSPAGTNALNSVGGANFRGMAPEAKLFVLGVDLTFGPLETDAFLQETAAATNYTVLARTNALISNNSWGYLRQFDYDSAAASYDAATRDALPEKPGPQGMIYIFAAGNSGAGNDIGTGGEPGTITSPGTGKNVITVGAIESPRFVSYEVVVTNLVTNIVNDEFVVTNEMTTNLVYLGETDTEDEVASFSSRGNVGIGQEGEFGRFKPDLVAPGVFLVSTRSTGWDIRRSLTNSVVNLYREQQVLPGVWNDYSIRVPTNAVRLIIECIPNASSPDPFPPLPIYVRPGTFPTAADYINTNLAILATNSTPALTPGTWYYSVGNDTPDPVSFDLRVIVEISLAFDRLYQTLTNISERLAPDYRYESGTSASAASVSGLLALVQEFWEQSLKKSYSPALFKALLINGARSLGPQYNFQVQNRINYQGWGIPNLTNTVPPGVTNVAEEAAWPMRWVDQSPTNALTTGDMHVYELTLPDGIEEGDLRVSLVWTDPPGNPAASTKLVNDLDLILSNKVDGTLYAGNDIPAGSDYVQASGTNLPPVFDTVNNVENVFLRLPAATNYTVYVVGRRVNVNAVTAHTNGIAQDYALVASIPGTNKLELKQVMLTNTPAILLDQVTNGLPRLHERVGANSPLLGYPIGSSNQWHFYVFTNTFREGIDLMTNGQYVYFITFVPPELGNPRNEQADIDLYVTRGDPGLLTLNPASLASSFRSLKRGGTELVAFTNAVLDEVFYVGVKSEDQMAAEYGFVALSSQYPGEIIDQYGNHLLMGMPPWVPVPDGSPVDPAAGLMFAVGISPIDVLRAIVTNTNVHERPGDLLGNLGHNSQFVVLNNHYDGDGSLPGVFGAVYDDSGVGDFVDSRSTDGPGSLNNFIGTEGSGVWILSMIDNALGQTGYVAGLQIRLEPNPDLLMGVYGTVLPNQWKHYFFDVPADASRLTVLLSQLTGPLNVYLRREVLPTTTDYDKAAFVSPPGGALSLSVNDSPPLTAGRYYIGLFNPSAASVDYFLQVRLERDLSSAFRNQYTTTNVTLLGDDVLTLSTNEVTDGRIVTDVKVGLRIDHPRASDLAVYLVSPQEERILLTENRGGTDWTRMGFDTLTTNFHHVALTYDRAKGVAALYLDGEAQVVREVGSFTPDTRNDLFLGHQPSLVLPVPQYTGGMDEVDLYARALDPGEIRGIYLYGGAGKPTNGLVSQWSFDGSGIDTQTNRNDAEVLGPIYVAGKFNQGIQFRNPGDQVRITNRAGLNVGAGTGFTLDAWINPADLATNRPLALWSDGTNQTGVEFSIIPGTTNVVRGVLHASLRDIAGSNHMLTASVPGLIRTNGVATNTVYLTFTEDTNRTTIPIKFANPASQAGYFTNEVVDGFERVTNAAPEFVVGDTFAGWQVTTGRVTVLREPLVAHSGTNALALARGTIVRTLPTRVGARYELRYAHRGPGMVSWWPGEGSVQDVIGVNHGTNNADVTFAPGFIGQALEFAVGTGIAEVPASRSLNVGLGDGFSIDCWINPRDVSLQQPLAEWNDRVGGIGTHFWISVQLAGGGPGSLYANLVDTSGISHLISSSPGVVSAGSYHHVAVAYRKSSGEARLYADGNLLVSTNLGAFTPETRRDLFFGHRPSGTAAGSSYSGQLDEIGLYDRAISWSEVNAIARSGRLGKSDRTLALPQGLSVGRVRITGAPAETFASENTNWTYQSVSFLATTNLTQLEFSGLQPGVLLDSVGIKEVESVEFLAEEPLTPLIGQTALGDWRIEVLDRRTGAINPIAPELISWQLSLMFAPPRIPTVQLTNAVPYTNLVGSGQAHYFMVDVPRSATRATNSLTSTLGLDLYFNQDGLPTFDLTAGDVMLLTNATAGIAVLATNGTYLADTNGTPTSTTNSLPVLEPGQRYYLAFTNTGPPQIYVIRVDFDALDTNIFGLRPLAYGETILTNIAVTNAMQYYRYDVTPAAVAASFELYPTNGNVHLYLRKAEPVVDPLPTTRVFDYASENPGSLPEIITVTRNDRIPLTAGPWYLGVLNVDTNEVTYRIHVTETTNVLEGVTILADGSPVGGTVASSPGAFKYYLYRATNNPAAIQFDLYGLAALATLYVQQDRKPVSADYLFLDPADPTAPAKILVRTNDALPRLDGDWYLGVMSDESEGAPPVGFTIMASRPNLAEPPLDLSTGTSAIRTLPSDLSGLPPILQYYRFSVAVDATNVAFAVKPTDGDPQLVLRRGPELPDLTNYDYASANPELTPEVIVLDAGSAPVPLTPGDWYLGVVNASLFSTSYRVEVTQQRANPGSPITINPGVVVSPAGVAFTWAAESGQVYQVQYANGIPSQGSIDWLTVPGVISPVNGLCRFVDDGTLTGGLGSFRIYRLVLVQP